MLQELVECLFEKGKDSAGRIFYPAGEPGWVYFEEKTDGSLSRHEATPAARSSKARDLETIVRFAQLPVLAGEEVLPEIWFSRDGVCVAINSNTRRDRVKMALQYSTQLQVLGQVSKGPFDQRAFVKLFRVDLPGSVPDQFIEAIRKIKFRVVVTGEAEVRNTRASIGKNLEAELSGAGTIPDVITVYVPVFDGILTHMRVGIQCAVDTSAETEKFYLAPLAGEIENGIRDVEERIRLNLANLLTAAAEANSNDTIAQIPVLYGSID